MKIDPRKLSPRPWHFGDPNQEILESEAPCVMDEDFTVLAEATDDNTYATNVANLSLMARAPRYHFALSEIARLVGGSISFDEPDKSQLQRLLDEITTIVTDIGPHLEPFVAPDDTLLQFALIRLRTEREHREAGE